MKTTPLAIACLALAAPGSPAQPTSSSASYEILHAPLGLGGGPVSGGAQVTAEVSIGEAFSGEVSSVTPAGTQHKPNYIGQLYDVTEVTVQAAPTTVNEGATRQLSATAVLDDLTLLALAAADVQWSVVLGPLTGISAAGLATADLVYQNTAATARGTYQGIDGQLALTVLDVNPDNFGGYAGDGISDGWQVGFFGPPPNADAEPGQNPDNDPHDNTTEFLTGYDPTDPGSFFTLEVVGLAGTTSTLELSKIIPGTRYRIDRSLDLEQSDPWTEFTNFTTLSEVFDHQVNDPNAVGIRWFYRVGVEPE